MADTDDTDDTVEFEIGMDLETSDRCGMVDHFQIDSILQNGFDVTGDLTSEDIGQHFPMNDPEEKLLTFLAEKFELDKKDINYDCVPPRADD